MSFLFPKMPKMPDPPAMPMPDDPAINLARERSRLKQRSQRGMEDTLKTKGGAKGVTGPAPITLKRAFGE